MKVSCLINCSHEEIFFLDFLMERHYFILNFLKKVFATNWLYFLLFTLNSNTKKPGDYLSFQKKQVRSTKTIHCKKCGLSHKY